MGAVQQLRQEIVLGLNADSTEFCPVEGLQHLLAVGTYELDEASQQRQGLLYLYELTATVTHDSDIGNCSWHLQQLHTQPLPGIFDMRWHCRAPARLLAACADGNLHLLNHTQSNASHQLQSVQQVEVASGAMTLSLDISASGANVVTSSSAGILCKLQVRLPNTNKPMNEAICLVGFSRNYLNCLFLATI